MKKYLHLFSALTLALCASMSINAQNTDVLKSDDGGVTLRNISSFVTDDSVRVSFTADVAKRSLKSCEAYVITPVLYTPSGTVQLQKVSVEGYRYRVTSCSDAQVFRYDNQGSSLPYLVDVARPTGKATGIELSIQIDKRSVCRSDRNGVVANYNDSIEYAYDPAKGDDDDNLRYGKSRSHFSAAGRANRLRLKNRKDNGIDPRMLKAAPDRKCLAFDSNTVNFNSKSVFPFDCASPIDSIFNDQLQAAVDQYNKLKADGTARAIFVEIAVASSPDGTYGYNKQLAQKRVNAVRNRLKKLSPEMADRAHFTPIAENWDELLNLVENSSLSNKDEVCDIILNTACLKDRKAKLRKLSNYREVYKLIKNTRTCVIDMMYIHDAD